MSRRPDINGTSIVSASVAAALEAARHIASEDPYPVSYPVGGLAAVEDAQDASDLGGGA